MLRYVLAGGLVAGPLTLAAPVAHAAAPLVAECRLAEDPANAIFGEGELGPHGFAVGVVVSGNPANQVSISCSLRVDVGTVANTPTGSGTGAAVTVGYVPTLMLSYPGVELCADWTDGSDSGSACVDATDPQVPPQEVDDLLFQVGSIPDPVLCPVLVGLAPGVPGVVDISAYGDVTFVGPVGWRFWDCPPYGS